MAAPSKRAKKIRSASDFDLVRMSSELRSPRASANAFSWNVPEIINARNEQHAGRFELPARMAESMRTDDALAVAYGNRLEPLRCIPVELVPAKGARGASIAAEADALFGPLGVGIHPDTLSDIHGCLVNHGVAFGIVVATPRDDGSRVDMELKNWPIEFVRWDTIDRCFKARVDPMGQPAVIPKPVRVEGEVQAYQAVNVWEEPIVHGDGRWVIFKKHETYPWRDEAAILSAAAVWARHALALRDWGKGSVAHGSAKVIGTMPNGVALQNATGPTQEATQFLELLKDVGSSDSPVGIKPFGSELDFLTNTSTAWQVFAELVGNGEKAAARIYLGTDGTLGTTGGAPGVDITALFGVATTKVKADAEAISRGLQTGLIEVWAAMNFGDSKLAPTRRYMLPDEEEDERRASIATRKVAFFADIASAREQGFDVTQEYVNETAEAYDVPAPTLLAASASGPTLSLTTKDVAGIVITVNEARASAGVGVLMLPDGVTPDPRGTLTIGEFNAGVIAKSDIATAPPAATPPAALRAV